MQITRRELLTVVATALAGCTVEEPPEVTGQVLGTEPIATTVPPTTTAITTITTTTTVPVRVVEAIGRAGWGAASPSAGLIAHTIERLTVHHTAVELADNRQAPARLRAHQRFHQIDRGWPDLAYHFAIDREGNVYEGRSPEFRGDTATNYDPTGHFLVVLEGNFDTQELPGDQLTSVIDLLAWAATEYDVSPRSIRGHRDYAETSCPGSAVYDLIASGDMTQSVSAVLEEDQIELTYLQDEAAQARVADIET